MQKFQLTFAFKLRKRPKFAKSNKSGIVFIKGLMNPDFKISN